MARTPNRRQREAARRRDQAAAEARQAATRRRQRIIAVVIVAVVVLSIFGAVIGGRSSTGHTTTTTTAPTTPTSTTRDLPASGEAPVAAPMGQSLTGATPCPADDGSSPRVTLFAEAPPTCIDPTSFYVASIRTTKGDLTVQLNPKRAPVTVNDFVVLARYHFYDGQPVTAVTSRTSFTIGVALNGTGSGEAPGFTIPVEGSAQGVVMVPGMLSMVPSGSPAASRGQLLVATFEEAAAIDPAVVSFGVMLSGDDTLSAIDSAATRTGQPAEAVTITSISVARSSTIPS